LGDEIGLRDCETCRGHVRVKVFECNHPLHRETTASQCKCCEDFAPRLVQGSVRNWGIGAVCESNAGAGFARIIAGLVEAGWSESDMIAINDLNRLENAAVARPESGHGVSGTILGWATLLAQLLERFPAADAYLLLDGDASLPSGSRASLEQVLWTVECVGAVSLDACVDRHESAAPVVQRSPDGRCSGCTRFVLPPASITLLWHYAAATTPLWRGLAGGRLRLDWLVSRWLQYSDLQFYAHHLPSRLPEDSNAEL
jgi:hypothetical protein